MATTQTIDGSVLEGGGQILRNTISFSALLSKPIKIEQIRLGRSLPGLKNQHRTGLELAARIASAQLSGATNGSTEIEFRPGKIELPGQWVADSVTAGATMLLLQIALPMLLFRSSGSPGSDDGNAASTVTLLGGTNADLAPQVDYIQHVFLPFFRRHFIPPASKPLTSNESRDSAGCSVELQIRKRGYHPKGGGDIVINVRPLPPGSKFLSVKLLERGRLTAIRGIAHYAGLPKVVGDGMCSGAVRFIKEKLASLSASKDDIDGEVEVDIKTKREPRELTSGAGSGIVLWAEFENGVVIGGSAVGSKKTEPAETGKSAAEELFRGIEAGGCVEEWLQDQIIIFMALAEGKSEVQCGTNDLTLHTRTAIWVAEQLTDAKFEVEQQSTGCWIIRCQGIGFTMS